MCRQVAVQAGAGIHPFTLEPMAPLRTMIVDLENGRAHLRRQLRPLWQNAPDLDPALVRVISLPSGINLLDPLHVDYLEERCDAHQPDLVTIGPIYKMANGDPLSEEVAKKVALVLDALRAKHECALLIEAHQPYANGANRRVERPYGASLWSRWPEYGLHLGATGELRHWRGDRDERAWPTALQRGGSWPWMPAGARAVTYARIVEEIQHAGRKLSLRELEMATGAARMTIDRAIKANQKHYDQVLDDLVLGPE
jgi:hypothetical protein